MELGHETHSPGSRGDGDGVSVDAIHRMIPGVVCICRACRTCRCTAAARTVIGVEVLPIVVATCTEWTSIAWGAVASNPTTKAGAEAVAVVGAELYSRCERGEAPEVLAEHERGKSGVERAEGSVEAGGAT